MVKILKEYWDKNQKLIREKIAQKLDDMESTYDLGYTDLVKIAFDCDFVNPDTGDHLNLESVHVIDDGDYQGTLIFMIPFYTYQPGANEYLMTYVYYGSCSGCDTLQGIMCETDVNRQIEDLTWVCKEILCATIKPYNIGWRHDPNWDQVEMD